jgi:hypothetical protein
MVLHFIVHIPPPMGTQLFLQTSHILLDSCYGMNMLCLPELMHSQGHMLMTEGFVLGVFKIGSFELFTQAGFEQ